MNIVLYKCLILRLILLFLCVLDVVRVCLFETCKQGTLSTKFKQPKEKMLSNLTKGLTKVEKCIHFCWVISKCPNLENKQ